MDIFQTLWIGELGLLQKVCLCSFVKRGYEVHLYSYDNIKVPNGIILKNAEEIFPKSELFTCQTMIGKGSFSPFSELFRTKLILEKGEWWIDSDIICLEPFDLKENIILCKELTMGCDQEKSFEMEQCGSAIFKFPAGHKLLENCLNEFSKIPREKIVWTDYLSIFNRNIKEMGLWDAAKDQNLFFPISWWDTLKLNDPYYEIDTVNSVGVHVFNEIWRNQPKLESFNKGSFLYEYYEITLDLLSGF